MSAPEPLDAAFASIRAEVEASRATADRFAHIRATIYINALKAGASTEEATAMADGKSEKPFITFMAEYIEARETTAHAAALAAARLGALEEALSELRRIYREGGWAEDRRGDGISIAMDAIRALAAQPAPSAPEGEG